MFELRRYQKDFILNLSKAVAQSKKVIACLPTGAGKTKCFLSINISAIKRGKTVLILTESKKIFKQIADEANGIIIDAKIGQHLYVYPNRTYVAMVQTLTRRPFIVDQFFKLGESLLIINDECHISTSTKLLLQLTNALLIGFTATPVYENAKHLPLLYKACVVGAQVQDLIDEGFLCSYRHILRVPAELDKLKLQKGEYTEQSQEAVFETDAVFDGLIEDLHTYPFKKAMIFCSSINHAEDTFERLEFNGFKCVRYHSKHELSQLDLLRFEQSSDINICVSVAALNKGYDHPAIDLTALVFKTTSLPRYLQSIGRASRIYPGKMQHICLDYGMNYMPPKGHGLWNWERPYETLWLPPDIKKKRKNKDELQVMSVKNCPECMSIIPASSQVCPYCAAVLVQEKEMQIGERVEVTAEFDSMKGRKISSLNAKELALYARMTNKKMFAIRIAKAKEQEIPGFIEQFGREMNYNYRWPIHMREQIGNEKIEFADIILK